jgi:hypothetical protein
VPAKPVNLGAILKAAGVESQLELLLLNRLERAGLPTGEAQFRIVPARRWKWDRAWPSHRVAADVQGGIYSRRGDGHNRPSKIENDCRKAAAAAALGWRVLPITEKMIREGVAVELIAAALGVEV